MTGRVGIRCVAAPACLALAGLLAAGAATAAGRDHPAAAAPAAPEAVAASGVPFRVRVMDDNQVHMTITNYGYMGNDFISRSPSLEYPFGTGYEHMVRGGLWVGAHAIDDNGPFIGVTTGALDGSQNTGGAVSTEYRPASEFEIRSDLPNSRYYSAEAVSELDLVENYDDLALIPRVANNLEDHRPLRVHVNQQNYAWSFSDYQHFIIFHMTIRNEGAPLQNAWLGFYTEFASGPKNAYANWPPTSGGSIYGGWYDKKLLEYDEDLHLMREHYCEGTPIPDGCSFSVVPYWIGVKMLGFKAGPEDTATKKVTFAAWNWSPGDTVRDTDAERYAIMSAGTALPLPADSLLPPNGDPVELLTIGPFSQIDPGDSVSFDFAVVGGAEIPDIQRHAEFAQRAFDRDYVVPEPPPSPRFKAVSHSESVDFYWDDSPESVIDPTSPIGTDFEGYRVYLGEDRHNLSRIAQFDLATSPHDTTGFNTGFGAIRLDPPLVMDGVTYHYRYSIGSLKDGFKYYAAVTAYDLGTTEIESLESGQAQNLSVVVPAPAPGDQVGGNKVTVFPNPYRVEARWDQGLTVRDHYLWFANLPERAMIRIYTLAGDLILEQSFDGTTYHGQNARGLYDPARGDVQPVLSGRSYGWNLITDQGQAAATGLYMYSVEDRSTGKTQVGKFLIVKSDREGL